MIIQNKIIATNYDKFKQFSARKFSEIKTFRTMRAQATRDKNFSVKISNVASMSERNQDLKERVDLDLAATDRH